MKSVTSYLTEKFKVSSNTKYREIEYPENKEELLNLIKKEVKAQGFDCDLNFIDTSKITDMSNLFADIRVGNPDITTWNTSNVTNMDYMFWFCTKFNCDISKWDVSKVETMNHTFDGCKSFNQDLELWDISSLKSKKSIFHGCNKLKLPYWAESK